MAIDEIARYNQARWEALAQAGVVYSRPFLDLNLQSAREVVDPQGILEDVTDREVLCLAGGGGQQSAAFALLGARVTVLDLTETQLQRDREAAAHYGVSIRTIQGDMRDLSVFADASFDIVWHAFSIDFIPDPRPVFREVARVIRPAGLYRLEYANPFLKGVEESGWDGWGYRLTHPYIDGAEVVFDDPDWIIEDTTGAARRVAGPREFRHALSTVVNTLVQLGFVLLGVWEELSQDPSAAPGTWEHLKLFAPPWLTFWATYRPDVIGDRVKG